jgi:DNA-binding CsgD family transcriptional regulator
MAERDELLRIVREIHAAALDPALWSTALASMSDIMGGVGATVEIIDRETFSHRMYHGHGVPGAKEVAYFEQYARMNPRLPPTLALSPGELSWDYQVLDETEMDRSPFYAEFLRPMNMRYVAVGILDAGPGEVGVTTVQRSPAQGHVSASEISLLRTLLPHVSQAIDTSRRLSAQAGALGALRETIDWLTDGAALLNADGRPLFVNASLRRIGASEDGVTLAPDRIEFAAAQAEFSFRRALAALGRLWAGEPQAGGSDFLAARPTGLPAYRVSLRPLSADAGGAACLLLIRDPVAAAALDAASLRQRFSLTQAEAHLGLAICEGVSPGDYALRQPVSRNTVYTHLRRLKEKCGCTRTVELIALLNAARGGSGPGI